LRGLEAVSAGFDGVNLVSDEKVGNSLPSTACSTSSCLPKDQKPAEDRIVHHVILKADVRDSSRLTRSLIGKRHERRLLLQPYFYDPVNKLLAKYGATKVFLEGDAIIVAVLEREGESDGEAGKACVLAWEICEPAARI